MTKEELAERLLNFAVRIGKVVDALPDTRLGRHVAGQLIRCGTSPAPNYDEACAAESPRDFVHKLSVVLKELRESRVWIRFIIRAQLLPAQKMGDNEDEATQLCHIIGKSKACPRAKRRSRSIGDSRCRAHLLIFSFAHLSIFRFQKVL